MKFEELTALQKIRIIQQPLKCLEECYILDILNDEEIWDEIKQHPYYLAADMKGDPYIWKSLMNDAEWEVKAKWAYAIYEAVKEVLDKGEDLK